MKRVIYYIVLTISGLGIPLFAYGIINTMVSLKYETENPTDCISSISGQNLCLTIKVFAGLILVCVLIIILLLTLRGRILDNNSGVRQSNK